MTDGQDNAAAAAAARARRGRRRRGAALPARRWRRDGGRAGPIGPRPGATKGNQVFKFSPDGKVLLTLGKPGGARGARLLLSAERRRHGAQRRHLRRPKGTAPATIAILKFDKTGKFIKEWGKQGTGPGEFDQPHALAFDSKGRLFVGDRNNNRVQIFDQDGKFIEEWHAVQPSERHLHRQERHPLCRRLGVANRSRAITTAGSAASASGSDQGRQGRRLHSRSGRASATGTSAAEGVAVDNAGNIYGAEVGPKAVKKYVKK